MGAAVKEEKEDFGSSAGGFDDRRVGRALGRPSLDSAERCRRQGGRGLTDMLLARKRLGRGRELGLGGQGDGRWDRRMTRRRRPAGVGRASTGRQAQQ
jgi:hypothetical protein